MTVVCAICRSYPCKSGCPNDYGWKKVGTCGLCGESIYVGEPIIDLDGDLYHNDCMEDASIEEVCKIFEIEVKDILEMCNIKVKEAEVPYD